MKVWVCKVVLNQQSQVMLSLSSTGFYFFTMDRRFFKLKVWFLCIDVWFWARKGFVSNRKQKEFRPFWTCVDVSQCPSSTNKSVICKMKKVSCVMIVSIEAKCDQFLSAQHKCKEREQGRNVFFGGKSKELSPFNHG